MPIIHHTDRGPEFAARRRCLSGAASVVALATILAACGSSSSDDGPSDSVTLPTLPEPTSDGSDSVATDDDPATSTVSSAPPVRDATSTPTSTQDTTPNETAPTPTTGEAHLAECRTQPNGRSPVGAVAVHGEVVASGLETPWGIAWLPDESMLVSERNGAVRHISPVGKLRPEPIVRVPATESSEGGLLGIAAHPDFATNRTFFVYYTSKESGGTENVVERYTLDADASSATSAGIVVDGIPASEFHSGGRLRFGPDGKLYIGTGDASQPQLSPDLKSLAGKLLRVNDDGSIPKDNPDPASPVWLSGIRNTQGFDWRPDGSIALTDHGPSGAPEEDGRTGHDEVTIARGGDDLGWPGVIGCDTADGAVTPSLAWTEAVPPGGAAIYTGTEIPEWTGDLFIGVLGFDPSVGHLHRVSFDEHGTAIADEAYFLDAGYGRIRDVTMGPDDALYFTTSNCDGRGECGEGDRIIRVGPGTVDEQSSTTESDQS